MEHINFTTILFLILGISLHVLIDFVKVKKTNKNFTFTKWYNENKLTVLISLIVGFVSLYFVDFALDGLGVIAEKDAIFYEAHAFISGFAPYATFAKIFKIEIIEN